MGMGKGMGKGMGAGTGAGVGVGVCKPVAETTGVAVARVRVTVKAFSASEDVATATFRLMRLLVWDHGRVPLLD